MRFSVAAAAAALVGSAAAADHLVVVGNGTLTFEPNNVKAAEGDTVTFKFWPKKHSVAQATFAKPCEPMEKGFWSGFVPSDKGAAKETFTVTVKNASQPLWFYCTQATHCQSGMVGVINGPASGNTIEKFTTAAANATKNTSPVSAAGTGGMLMGGNSTSGSMGGMDGMNNSTSNGTAGAAGAASSLSASNGAVFISALGMVAYMLL